LQTKGVPKQQVTGRRISRKSRSKRGPSKRKNNPQYWEKKNITSFQGKLLGKRDDLGIISEGKGGLKAMAHILKEKNTTASPTRAGGSAGS